MIEKEAQLEQEGTENNEAQGLTKGLNPGTRKMDQNTKENVDWKGKANDKSVDRRLIKSDITTKDTLKKESEDEDGNAAEKVLIIQKGNQEDEEEIKEDQKSNESRKKKKVNLPWKIYLAHILSTWGDNM